MFVCPVPVRIHFVLGSLKRLCLDSALLSEFMVEEHELQKEKIQEDYNDKYWDQRYTIVQHRIPSFLQKMADKILSTGES